MITTIATWTYVFIPILLLCYAHRLVRAVEAIVGLMVRVLIDDNNNEEGNDNAD